MIDFDLYPDYDINKYGEVYSCANDVITIQYTDIDNIDKLYNVDGKSWGIFGCEPISGYMVIDNGCGGNWYHAGLLAKEIRYGIEMYGIKKFTLYYGERFADWDDMEKVTINIG